MEIKNPPIITNSSIPTNCRKNNNENKIDELSQHYIYESDAPIACSPTDTNKTPKCNNTSQSSSDQQNTTSWILAAAAALYWRVLGNTEEAITCLRQALTFVPNDMKDIPLISLANILHRVGFHGDALEVSYIALESKPEFPVNHFTVGNIHTSVGDLEKAIGFYRHALALDPNFEPARNRLQAILCTFLFDENGSLRDITEMADN